MPVQLTALTDLARLGFDTIIDVRSPAEYAEDHIPGAISLPVLSDDERARVGWVYKQVSPFDARKLGAALVARNAAHHLQTALADRPGGWRPLVYCWRGGQRSGAFTAILQQIGWRAERVEGGYKAWRKLVLDVLNAPVPAPVVLLDGNTGSAKTAVLNRLPDLGVQAIDLEGLANHRGSVFGALGAQPAQRAFEGRLALALAALDPARPVAVEAESSAIGRLKLPARLWKAMGAAPRLEIRAPRAERARYLARAYGDVAADPARLLATIERLRPFHAAARIAEWQALAAAGAFEALAEGLMEAHYDPRYARHRARMGVPVTPVPAPGLGPGDLPGLAARVAAAIQDPGSASGERS